MKSDLKPTPSDINSFDEVLSLIKDKGRHVNAHVVNNRLSIDLKESEYIFNTFCYYCNDLSLIVAEFFDDKSASIVSVNKPKIDRFIESGGFKDYFKEKESKKVNNIHNETVYGDKIQGSSFRDFKPISSPANVPNPKAIKEKPSIGNTLSKYWWRVIVPIICGLTILVIWNSCS
jgi:hypothetical protein